MANINNQRKKAIRGTIVLSELIDPLRLVVGAKMKTFTPNEEPLLLSIIDLLAYMLNQSIVGGIVSFHMECEYNFLSRQNMHSDSEDEVMLVKFIFSNHLSLSSLYPEKMGVFWHAEKLYEMISVGDQITAGDSDLRTVLIKRKSRPRFLEIKPGGK